MALVAGVDTSTQACKVVVRDAETGDLVRSGRAAHPDGTEVPPAAWERAFSEAAAMAGGLDDVAALAVGGQQHGMVCLDEYGAVVRDALLWNDVRSAGAAADLITELGDGDQAAGRPHGPRPSAWCRSPPSPGRSCGGWPTPNLRRPTGPRAVCLPHDWLTWRLRADRDLGSLVTDRGDASGTAYWSARTGEYRLDLLELAMRGRRPAVPRVAGPREVVGTFAGSGAVLGPGTGDNAAAALGAGRPAGRRRRLDRHLRRRLRGHRHRRRRSRPAPSPGSPTRPGGTCRWSPRSTRRGCSTRRPRCSASTTRRSPTWRCRRRPGPADSCSCPTSRASGRRTCRGPPVRCTA